MIVAVDTGTCTVIEGGKLSPEQRLALLQAAVELVPEDEIQEWISKDDGPAQDKIIRSIEWLLFDITDEVSHLPRQLSPHPLWMVAYLAREVMSMLDERGSGAVEYLMNDDENHGGKLWSALARVNLPKPIDLLE